MKRSQLKYFAWISLVCMLCFSCRSSRIIISGEQAGKMSESFLTGSFEKITCKAKVIFHENELSGLMLIKKTDNENYRLAFYNELGMTYLEGTFENSAKHEKLIVKNIAPIINYKSFIKSFEKSLQIIFSDKVNPCTHATMPPSPHAAKDESTLKIQLHNGFLLELSPK